MYEPTPVLKSEKGRYVEVFKSRAGRDLRFHVHLNLQPLTLLSGNAPRKVRYRGYLQQKNPCPVPEVK